MCCFSVEGRSIAELGFGSIFEGGNDLGNLANISTQAVMDLMHNMTVPTTGSESPFVEIGGQEILAHNIPRAENIYQDETNVSGVFNKLLIMSCFYLYF